jgi:hypothetical protein
MTLTELHEWFEAESNSNSVLCYSTMIGGYTDKYVEWIERRLLGYQARMCKLENCKYQDNEADGIVFCGKCGKSE